MAKKSTFRRSFLAAAVAAAVPVYLQYQKDMRAAWRRVTTGSNILRTPCGPLEYATLGEGAPVLVLHGTSGGWDQGIAAARELVHYGFQLIAPSRFGYLRTPLPADSQPPAEADAWICLLDALHIERLPVISYSAGAAPAMQLALRHPDRISAEVFMVPGSGGICPQCFDTETNPPRALLDAIYRSNFPMWLAMRLAPRFMYTLVAVPAGLVPTLSPQGKAELKEAIQSMLPVSPRRLGVLNEGNTQGTQTQYPIEQVNTPCLFISAEDDLYNTLSVARHAAQVMHNTKLIEYPTGGHLLLDRGSDVWPAVAEFLREFSPVQDTS